MHSVTKIEAGEEVPWTADTGSIYVDLPAMSTQTERRRRDSQEFRRMLREADGDIERLRQAAASARSLLDEQLEFRAWNLVIPLDAAVVPAVTDALMQFVQFLWQLDMRYPEDGISTTRRATNRT